jgi:hypothetical protein
LNSPQKFNQHIVFISDVWLETYEKNIVNYANFNLIDALKTLVSDGKSLHVSKLPLFHCYNVSNGDAFHDIIVLNSGKLPKLQ